MTSFDPEDTLKEFILRARKIKNHSLVKDWEALKSHAVVERKVELDETGEAKTTLRLPVNEEAFESLAARVRPITLKDERIHHAQVFRAIYQLLGDGREQSPFWSRFSKLKDRWKKVTASGNKIHTYGVQIMSEDGSFKTEMISDIALAKAWLYRDLVHANLTKDEVGAVNLPLEERYVAAVHIYSFIAVLVVLTLELVQAIHDSGKITLPGSAWEEEVTIGKAEVVDRVRAYSAPLGTEVPDISIPFSASSGWSSLTASAAAGLSPENRVDVKLVDDSGQTVKTKKAFVVGRFSKSDDRKKVTWHIVVAEGALAQVSFHADGRTLATQSVKMEPIDQSNKTRLAWSQFALDFLGASRIDFEYSGTWFASLAVLGTGEDTVANFRRREEVYSDLVQIEKITGKPLERPSAQASLEERLLLRQIRLLWQGKVIQLANVAQPTIKDGAPSVEDLIHPESSLKICGIEIPTPKFRAWHAKASFAVHQDLPELGPKFKLYSASAPEGEFFLAWSPDLVEVDTSKNVTPTAKWNLSDIPE
jgi:hypothetical protein